MGALSVISSKIMYLVAEKEGVHMFIVARGLVPNSTNSVDIN